MNDETLNGCRMTLDASAKAIRFVLNGDLPTAAGIDPHVWLRQYLREGLRLTDTKELFRRHLAERGLDATRVVCPIGAGASGKKDQHPGAIAIATAVQFLARRNAMPQAFEGSAAHA